MKRILAIVFAVVTAAFWLALCWLVLHTSDCWAGDNYRQYVKTECEWCGATENLEVHHIIPQSTCKLLRLTELLDDPRNLVTFCRSCHFIIGHMGDWHTDNPELAAMLHHHRMAQIDAAKEEGGQGND